MEKKRERGKNYIEEEKENLLEIIKELYKAIENKQTDGTSVKLKNEAWEAVAEQYNATAQTGSRSSSQLKLLYDCIKKKVKKDKANEKVEVSKTGGGSSKGQLDPIGEKVLALKSANSTQEITNIYDSDATFDDILQMRDENYEPIEEIRQKENKPSTSEDFKEISTNARKENLTKLRPGILYHKYKKIDNNSSDKENLKLDILKIRKEKEELSRDIIKLEKRKLELEIQEKLCKLKEEYDSDFNSNY